METRTKVCYWLATLMAFALTMGIAAFAPEAHAAELQAGSSDLVLQTTTLDTQVVKAAKATSNPYPDVTKKSVGAKALKSIKWMKAKGAYKGVAKNGKKFYPFHPINRGEFVKVIKNLYGAKVTKAVTSKATTKNKLPATDKWTKGTLERLAKLGYGMKIKYPTRSSARVGRATIANLIYNFAHFDPALMP